MIDPFKGLDIELADAVHKEFCENYETWKKDNPNSSTRQQVISFTNFSLTPDQIRQWVRSWHAHLGDRATPRVLVDAIVKNRLAAATKLKDQIEREFELK